MTVQELIDALEKVEDKEQAIYYPDGPREVEIDGFSSVTMTLYTLKTREPYQAIRLIVY